MNFMQKRRCLRCIDVVKKPESVINFTGFLALPPFKGAMVSFLCGTTLIECL